MDLNFLPHAWVTLYSILRADSSSGYHFHFISTQALGQHFAPHHSFFKGLGCGITLYQVSPCTLKSLPASYLFPAASYLRLLAPEVLQGFDQALYLDADIICLRGLAGLWGALDSSALVAAVEDSPQASQARIASLGLQASRYFNSGMLLMNLERWRGAGVTEQVLACLYERRHSLQYPDQDALNIVLQGRVQYLPGCWNHQLKLGLPHAALPADTALLHYVGEHKPWHIWNDQPAALHYRALRAQLPWGSEPYQGPATSRHMKAMARYCMRQGQVAAGFKWMFRRKFADWLGKVAR